MPLTSQQLATLKSTIDADSTLNVQPRTSDGNQTIADAMNAKASPDYFVWDSAVPVLSILDKVTWANFTPNPTISGSNAAQWQACAMNAQNKQANLQLLTVGRTAFDATKVNLRAALNDATTNLPTGAAFALVSGGWANILPVLSRKATRAEKLYATDDGAGIGNTVTDPRGASTNPDFAAFEGSITSQDVDAARNL